MPTFYLAADAALKRLETPSVYRIATDELYELDAESFSFLEAASSPAGISAERNEFVSYCEDEGLLTTAQPSVRRPPVLRSSLPSLRYLELQITDRCNLRCRHCYIGGKGHADLPLESVAAVVREFEEMQGLRLLITGGEPLLHPAFSAINELLPGLALRKVLFSNGLLVTKDVLQGLDVDELQVSIDGLEASHDAVRGRGSFRKALDAVAAAADAGLAVSVATMVHAENLGEFDEMDRLFRGLGVREWSVDVPCATGSLADNPGLCIPPERGGPLLGYGFGGGFHGGSPGYACGLHLMAVSAHGETGRCTFYTGRTGCSIGDGLRTCWERIRPLRLDELACDCSFREECRGGCRFRAELSGDPLGPDLYKCSLYGIMSQK